MTRHDEPPCFFQPLRAKHTGRSQGVQARIAIHRGPHVRCLPRRDAPPEALPSIRPLIQMPPQEVPPSKNQRHSHRPAHIESSALEPAVKASSSTFSGDAHFRNSSPAAQRCRASRHQTLRPRPSAVGTAPSTLTVQSSRYRHRGSKRLFSTPRWPVTRRQRSPSNPRLSCRWPSERLALNRSACGRVAPSRVARCCRCWARRCWAPLPLPPFPGARL